MKRILVFIFASLCSLFFFSLNVKADAYTGDWGYKYFSTGTEFYYLNRNSDVEKVYLHLGDDEVQMIPDASDVFFYSVSGDQKNKEFYYRVCYQDTTCVNTLDPFVKTLNINKDKHVILDDNDLLVENWNNIKTLEKNKLSASIYVVDGDSFTANIGDKTVNGVIMDSVFEKMILRDTLSYENIGYAYLENAGYSFLEIGNLNDPMNYFYPNIGYASGIDETDAIIELKNFIMGYKNINMNVVLRTNFITPSEEFKNELLRSQQAYIVDNKINTNNGEMQRYLTEVYKYWVSYYKIDGFYIEDASLYNQEFLATLISELKQINSKLFIYSADTNLTGYHVSDDLQNALVGSLLNTNKEGVVNGSYDADKMTTLANSMFGGTYNDASTYDKNGYRINTLGSVDGLDIYSKILLVGGLGTREEDMLARMRMINYIFYASTGIPRIISGNEFANATRIPTSDIATTPEEKMVCNSAKTICYAIKDLKSISWEYLVRNGTSAINAYNYRTKYYYQFPSSVSLASVKSVSLNNDYANDGILYLSLEYNATKNDDIEKSIVIINFANTPKEIAKISDKKYTSSYALVGSVGENDGNTVVGALTLFTFTEIRNNRLPNWVYVVIAILLILGIFGLRYLLIKLLKNKQGIDYKEMVRQERIKRREERKGKRAKERKESVFETYLADDPIFKRNKKNKKETSEERENPPVEEKVEVEEQASTEEEKENKK